MCRLIGAISLSKIDAADLLYKFSQSLLRQSNIDHRRKQSDGWGAAWIDKSKPSLHRRTYPMYRDAKKVRAIAKKSKGNVFIGHVRWASNPLKLKHAELIGLNHTQPFTHGPWIFAHNGTLFIPREVTAHLGPWKRNIKGKNDSEVLFYWLLKHFPKENLTSATPRTLKKVRSSVRKALTGLQKIWKNCKKRYPIHAFPYHGLNWVLSNGKVLIAFCLADPRGFGKARALCNRRQCYYQLQRSMTPTTVTIASEPLHHNTDWHAFGHGELFMASRSGGHIVTQKAKVL